MSDVLSQTDLPPEDGKPFHVPSAPAVREQRGTYLASIHFPDCHSGRIVGRTGSGLAQVATGIIVDKSLCLLLLWRRKTLNKPRFDKVNGSSEPLPIPNRSEKKIATRLKWTYGEKSSRTAVAAVALGMIHASLSAEMVFELWEAAEAFVNGTRPMNSWLEVWVSMWFDIAGDREKEGFRE